MSFNSSKSTYQIILAATLPIYNPNYFPVRVSGTINVSFYDQQAGTFNVSVRMSTLGKGVAFADTRLSQYEIGRDFFSHLTDRHNHVNTSTMAVPHLPAQAGWQLGGKVQHDSSTTKIVSGAFGCCNRRYLAATNLLAAMLPAKCSLIPNTVLQ